MGIFHFAEACWVDWIHWTPKAKKPRIAILLSSEFSAKFQNQPRITVYPLFPGTSTKHYELTHSGCRWLSRNTPSRPEELRRPTEEAMPPRCCPATAGWWTKLLISVWRQLSLPALIALVAVGG